MISTLAFGSNVGTRPIVGVFVFGFPHCVKRLDPLKTEQQPANLATNQRKEIG